MRIAGGRDRAGQGGLKPTLPSSHPFSRKLGVIIWLKATLQVFKELVQYNYWRDVVKLCRDVALVVYMDISLLFKYSQPPIY